MLVWVAVFASLSGYLFGYDLGLIGGALLNIKEEFGTSDGVNEVIVGAAKLGAFCGTFLGGALMLYYGRRLAIGIDSLFFIAGPLLMAAAGNVGTLVVGRFVVGVGIGVSAVVVPAYLGEVSPAQYRGRVVELYELLLCVGMLSASLGDAAFQSLPSNWRWMVGVPAIPALLMTLALCLLPESPRWLVIHGRLDEALAVIHRIYTSKQLPQGLQNSNAEVNQELLELWSSVEKDKAAAEERRARRAAAREARQTKVAPLAAAQEEGASGGVRFKGGWVRLEEQQAEPALELEEVQLDAATHAGHAGALAASAAGEAQPPLQRPPLPPGPAVAAVAAGPHDVPLGPAQLATAAPMIDWSQQQQQQQPAVQMGQEAGGAGSDASAAQSDPETPQRTPQRVPGWQLGTPFGGSAGSGGGGGAGTGPRPAADGGVSPEDVLPVPPTLRRIRTRSTEFEVAQEDLPPLDASAVPPLLAGTSLLTPPGTALRVPEEEGGYLEGDDGYLERARTPGGGHWWRPFGPHGGLRARRGSTVPWTAQRTLGQRRPGFWSTLGDMCLDIYIVFRGPERGALRLALWLAFFNQAFASTAIINYAPEVLRRAGVESHTSQDLFTAAIGGSKLVGVVLSFFLVDSLGRRPLLIYGSLGSSLAMALMVLADWLALVPFLALGMCAFIFFFSTSWAGVFWVLLSEMFSMSVKSPAVSAATATLFLTGAVSDLVFLSLHSWLGPFCFAVFAAVALVAGIYVAKVLPETKERTLAEVQQLLGGGGNDDMGSTSGAGESSLLSPGAARSAPAVDLGLGRRRRRGWLRWR